MTFLATKRALTEEPALSSMKDNSTSTTMQPGQHDDKHTSKGSMHAIENGFCMFAT